MAKKRKRTKKKNNVESEELKKAPHSFVINKGQVGKNVNRLILELRSVLEPNTASQLKVKKTNVMKDFINIASIFHVTHLICFTKTQKNIFMRFCRVPHGPTLIFRVNDYVFGKDVRSSLRRPLMNQKLFRKSPLLVMNSFIDEDNSKPHLKLITSMFKTMFPFIDVNNVKLRTVKRCVMLNYNSETGLVDFRHYAVKIKPVGLSKPVKKLVSSKKIPNLSKLQSLDDIMEQEHGFTSESEGELDEVEEQRHVIVPEPMKTGGNVLFEKSAIRCVEIGPRLTLELIKIQEKLCGGKVLFNKLKDGKVVLNFEGEEESDIKNLDDDLLQDDDHDYENSNNQEADLDEEMNDASDEDTNSEESDDNENASE